MPLKPTKRTKSGSVVAGRSRGRPRAFDPKVGLERAKRLFWAKGLAGTSIADLTDALHIAAPSIYAAFGDKRNLFREAVKSYVEQDASVLLRTLEVESIEESIHQLLLAAVQLYAGPDSAMGCLIVTGAINCTPEDAGEAEVLKAQRAELGMLIEHRLRKSLNEGELKPGTDVDALAKFYHTYLNGLALRARDGDVLDRLLPTVEAAMCPLRASLATPGVRPA